jgi:hypothetical protein
MTQGADAPITIPLHPSAETPISIAYFRSWGATQCDGRGNLYFRIGDNLNQTTIRRLTPDAATDTYTLPSEYAQTTTYLDFRATAHGELHVLVADSAGHLHVFSFQRDSSDNPTHVQLDAPAHISTTAFAVFPTGTILISGFYDKDAPQELSGKRYSAEFDASGRLRRTVDTHAASLDAAKPPASLGAISAPDERGTLYLAQGDELLVIGEGGEIERKFTLTRPAPEYSVGHIQIAAGRIGIWFMRAETRKPIVLRLSVLDPAPRS